MATLTFAYNHAQDPMNPQDLGDKIAAALAIAPAATVDITPTQIVVSHPSITSANTAAIQGVITGYTLTPGYTGPAGTPQGNLGVLTARAAAALNANSNFLALASPTNAQTLAQVQTLTKECNALIRLALNLLDSSAGT